MKGQVTMVWRLVPFIWLKKEFMEEKEYNKLIDRLEFASNTKYPNRLYTPQFKEQVRSAWRGHEDALKNKVEELENELGIKHN
jgi:hypothetical protein